MGFKGPDKRREKYWKFMVVLLLFQTRFFKDRPETVERLRKKAESFVDSSLATDACLIFAPSQVSCSSFEFSCLEKGGLGCCPSLKHTHNNNNNNNTNIQEQQ